MRVAVSGRVRTRTCRNAVRRCDGQEYLPYCFLETWIERFCFFAPVLVTKSMSIFRGSRRRSRRLLLKLSLGRMIVEY